MVRDTRTIRNSQSKGVSTKLRLNFSNPFEFQLSHHRSSEYLEPDTLRYSMVEKQIIFKIKISMSRLEARQKVMFRILALQK